MVGRFGGPEFAEAQRVAKEAEDHQAPVCGVQGTHGGAARAEGDGVPVLLGGIHR